MVVTSRLTGAFFAVAPLVLLSAGWLESPSASAATLPPGPVLGHPADYVIVSPSAFAAEFQRLADDRTRIGIPGYVKTVESIVAEYPNGRDDAERVRLFLQDAKQQWNTRWALLGGLPPEVPARRIHSTFFGGLDLVTDLYFGALRGTWDANRNGIFGEATLSSSEPGDSVDLHVDVFVGRAPTRTVQEARDFVSKTIAAGANADVSAPHQALLAADVLFPNPWVDGTPLTLDGADLAEQARTVIVANAGAQVDRLYQNWNDPRWPDAQPLSRVSLLAALRAGPDFYLDVNRGGPMVMTAGNDSVPAADLAGLIDAARPTQAWLSAAFCGNFEGDCLASALVRGPSGGAATCAAASSLVFTSVNYQPGYVSAIYPPASKSEGEALALAKLPFIAYSDGDGTNRLMQMGMNLFGDPALHLRPIAPAPLTAAYPAQVAIGRSEFDVEVQALGQPVAGARVCAWLPNQALAIAATNAVGYAHLVFDPAQTGTARLTIVAPDGGQLEGTINVYGAAGIGAADPASTRLDAPAPNPAFTHARLSGATRAGATLALYDLTGRRVRSFAIAPGAFDRFWDLSDDGGRRVPAGIYFVRLRSGSITRLGRLLVTP